MNFFKIDNASVKRRWALKIQNFDPADDHIKLQFTKPFINCFAIY